MKLKLHYTYKLPGDIEQPSMMTIINEKLDLVERLNNLIESRSSQSQGFTKVKEMIEIEMDAIYEMIQLDTITEKEENPNTKIK